MKKELLVFGSNGALGGGVTEVFLTKDYDKIHLFGSRNEIDVLQSNTVFHQIKDLAVEENVEEAFRFISPDKDKLFFLFSTVGGFEGGKKLWETDLASWEKMMKMNLQSSFLIAKYFSRIVKASAGGSICFTAAYTGAFPEANKAAYGTAKGGLIHFVKLLAEDGREIKLTVNAVAPFIIDTPANRAWMKDADFNSWIKAKEIGEFVHSLFDNFHFINGNIFTFKERLQVEEI